MTAFASVMPYSFVPASGVVESEELTDELELDSLEELLLELEELEEELEELLELELELLEELLLELEESLLEPPFPPPPPPPQAVSIARTITPARRAAAKRLNIFIVMFLLFSNSDGLGDPKSLYPSEFILSIPPPHVNRHIAQIPPFFLAIVPKHKKAPRGGADSFRQTLRVCHLPQ